MSLTLTVCYTATNRVLLIHERDGRVTSRYNLPAFPQVMRRLYEQLHYTIRDVPYRMPAQEVRHDPAT